MFLPTICGPTRSKSAAHTRESVLSSPPSCPCSARQLRSGNTHARIASCSAIASAPSPPAIPSSETDMPRITLLIVPPFLRLMALADATASPLSRSGPGFHYMDSANPHDHEDFYVVFRG